MKTLTLVSVLLCLVLTPPSHAQFLRPGARAESAKLGDVSFWGRNHYFSLLLDNWKYEEPGLMKDSGFLGGVGYAYKGATGVLYYEANVEFLLGWTEYDGQLSDGTPYVHDSTNRILMGQLWTGVQVGDPHTVGFIPKVGLLFRRLVDANDEASGDYQRDQDYFAIPIGLDILFPAGPGQLALTGFATAYFSGVNKTHFTDVGGDNDPTFKQDKGRGMELGISYQQDQWHAGFFFRKWKVEDSDAKLVTFPAAPTTINDGLYIEPENDTISYGIKGGVAF